MKLEDLRRKLRDPNLEQPAAKKRKLTELADGEAICDTCGATFRPGFGTLRTCIVCLCLT